MKSPPPEAAHCGPNRGSTDASVARLSTLHNLTTLATAGALPLLQQAAAGSHPAAASLSRSAKGIASRRAPLTWNPPGSAPEPRGFAPAGAASAMAAFEAPPWAAEPTVAATLRVASFGEEEKAYDVGRKPWVVLGRNGGGADIVIEDPSVSRLHCALVHHQDGRLYLIDLSSHGTTVDGEPIKRHKPTKAKDGSTVSVETRRAIDRKRIEPPSTAFPSCKAAESTSARTRRA